MSKQQYPSFKGKVIGDGFGIHYFNVDKSSFPEIEELGDDAVIEILTKEGSVIGAVDTAYMGAAGALVALNVHD